MISTHMNGQIVLTIGSKITTLAFFVGVRVIMSTLHVKVYTQLSRRQLSTPTCGEILLFASPFSIGQFDSMEIFTAQFPMFGS